MERIWVELRRDIYPGGGQCWCGLRNVIVVSSLIDKSMTYWSRLLRTFTRSQKTVNKRIVITTPTSQHQDGRNWRKIMFAFIA